MEVLTERNPSWINWITPDKFNDYDLFRIIIFLCFTHHAQICLR